MQKERIEIKKEEKIVIIGVISILLGIIAIMGYIAAEDYITSGDQAMLASSTVMLNFIHRASLFVFSFVAIGIGMVNMSLKKYGRLAIVGLILGIIAVLIFITLGF